MTSPHVFQFGKQSPQDKTEAGERIKAYSGNFPILKGMSLYKLVLRPRGVREPHWHPNADELGYCLKGQVLVSFYHTNDLKQTFVVHAGEMFFIPSGALHTIANVGNDNAELLLQFAHENAEEFGLAGSVGMFSNAVLGNTWGVSSDYFNLLKRPLKNSFAVFTPVTETIPKDAYHSSAYRYNAEGSKLGLDASGGFVRMAKQNMWPILRSQSLYSLKLNDKGMREPHWHPETAELGYVNAGQGRMSILNPDGKIDTYLLEQGDLYFIPKAYPHHIENVGEGTMHFLIFFDQPMPEDIGFTGSVRSFSDEVLGSVLGIESSFFNGLNKYYSDLFIVDKINPTD